VEYSQNGLDFHDVFQDGDVYIRIELVDGSYTPPIRIVGTDGTSVTILGTYTSEADLNAAHPTGNTGDAYTINGELWVWNPTDNAWINVGRIKGDDGLPVVLENDGTKIVWHYANDSVLHDLVLLSDLKGETGETGETGATGATGAAGTNGKQVELQDNGTYIQWRYVGDSTWINLVAKSSLKGDTGTGVPEIGSAVSVDYPVAYLTATMVNGIRNTAWVRKTEILTNYTNSVITLSSFTECLKITYIGTSDINLSISSDPSFRKSILHLSCTVMIYNANGSGRVVNVQGDVVFKDGINSFEINAGKIGEVSFSGIEYENGNLIIRGIFY
jgi:hypothetical protein